MTTIRKFFEGQDLFGKIGMLENFPFIDEKMMPLFILEHGQGTFYSALESATVDDIAEMVVKLYGDRWKDLVALEKPSLGAREARKLTENVDSTQDNTNSQDTTQKVTAYNDPAFIDDSQEGVTGTSGQVGNQNKTTTEEWLNLKSIYEGLTIDKKINIINVAIKDVANFVKIDIYS